MYIYNVDCNAEEFHLRLRSVLVQAGPVISATWNPVNEYSIALSCGGCAMYTWTDSWAAGNGGFDGSATEEMAECVGVPASESIHLNLRRLRRGRFGSLNSGDITPPIVALFLIVFPREICGQGIAVDLERKRTHSPGQGYLCLCAPGRE